MAQIIVRNLKDKTVKNLKRRAEKDSRSLQEETKSILVEESRKMDRESFLKWTDDFRKRQKGRKFSDSAELIREDRDR